MFIDTHCHISDKYYNDIDKTVLENEKAGIEKMIISGCDKNEIESSIVYINTYKNIYATIGYHPSEAKKVNQQDLLNLERLVISNKKIVGIGEIGLDYHYGKEDILIQQEIFRKQLSLAEKLHIPVVIHSRDATNDTINILKDYRVRGVIHCFSGSLETAKIYISMGYKLGIGGVITFKNSKLVDVIDSISLDNIVLETDSPYLAPVPHRGETNSSKYVPIIARKIAEIKKTSIEEVSKATLENTYNVFDLK